MGFALVIISDFLMHFLGYASGPRNVDSLHGLVNSLAKGLFATSQTDDTGCHTQSFTVVGNGLEDEMRPMESFTGLASMDD